MSRSKSHKNSKQGYQGVQTSGNGSAEEMNNRNIKSFDQDEKKQDPSTLQKHGKKIYSATGGGILLGVLFYFIKPSFTAQYLQESQYRFKMYCPVTEQMVKTSADYPLDLDNYQLQQNYQTRFLTKQLGKSITNWDDGVQRYIVYVQEHATSDENGSVIFMYCSWVTDWINKDCSNPQALCTSPGPIFYVARNQTIDVAWVYNITNVKNNSFKTDERLGCYYNSGGDHCKIQKKSKNSCTYLDSTDQQPSEEIDQNKMTITNTSIPISVHVHGLQVRPVFDGNPLSWLGPDGQIGTGFQSLALNQQYFASFRNKTTTLLKPENNSKSNYYFKVNRYQNFQPPGNLWYHDHSMHVTSLNVQLGMAGDYIIYDPTVQKGLPNSQYQIFIVAGQYFKNQNGTNNKANQNQKIQGLTHSMKMNPANIPFNTQTNLTFQRNQTYRIRILNGQFDSIFTNLRFVTLCDNPTDKQDISNITKCNKTLQYTVIGSDSSLFNTTVRNVTNITVASAQRFQILIIFDGVNAKGETQNPIHRSAKQIFLVTDQKDINQIDYIRLKYPLEDFRSINQKASPFQVKYLNLSYYNLSQIQRECNENQVSTECISVKRMRPLFLVNSFFFNGHYSFTESGASDNPKIGTTQDWYFINTKAIIHPVHVHLINYQIVNKTILKTVTYNQSADIRLKKAITCSYYEMDYFIEAGIYNTSQSYLNICFDLRKNLDFLNNNSQKLNRAYREDEIQSKTRISGFDVKARITKEDQGKYNSGDFCQKDGSQQYKYICSQFSNKDIPQYYRRWKEVALLQYYEVLQVRIRWTSTEYNTPAMSDPYPYFKVPEDQLIEFPGYVYHCHFLPHEDNELMRPIMMQPSDKFAENYPISDLPQAVQDCMKRNGYKNQDGWKARYNCINEFSGC